MTEDCRGAMETWEEGWDYPEPELTAKEWSKQQTQDLLAFITAEVFLV